MSNPITREELLKSVKGLHKCVVELDKQHTEHLAILQDEAVYLRRDLTKLQSATRMICAGGGLLAMIVILQLIGWI